ncbi:MAG: CapA family protein, partial [Anaerolineae bacterium]
AHRMIDNGANAVLGSGPHILQPVELYKGGVIAYSLGNFVFDHRNMKCKQSMILHISFTNGRIESINITPVLISDDCRPQPIDPDTNPTLYESIKSLLVHQLDEFESDAKIIPLGGKGLMMRALKRIVWSDQRAYPLSVYFRGFVEMIKERVFIKN